MKEADYTFDIQNRLTQVAGEGKKLNYTYNGDGLLYERKGKTRVLTSKIAYIFETLVIRHQIFSTKGSHLSCG